MSYARMPSPDGPELVIGLVTPVGTNTSVVADRLRTALSQWNYRSKIVKVTDFFNKQAPQPSDEYEDERVRRLIDAGDSWCRKHDDAAAMARLAILDIRSTRLALHRKNGVEEPDDELLGRPVARFAYIVHSLKRPTEVALLRRIYGPQFVLLGCQADHGQRLEHLLQRPLSGGSTREAREEIALELMRLDANEDDPMGQRVNETFPMSDYFLLSDESADRFINLLFGDPTIPPDTGELAMYLAQATSLQSLAASRRVGASLVLRNSVVAVGCNEVPAEELPDVHTGHDSSDQFKRALLRDTLECLKKGGLLADTVQIDDSEINRARDLLKDSQLMSVIEYQRPVHAEAAAISDAARRGQAVEGTELYCTTYPCHLCFKAALAVGIERLYYIEPYPKSRATLMFPRSGHRLVPYHGVAPRSYLRVFEREMASADDRGEFRLPDRSTRTPLLPNILRPNDIAAEEAAAVEQLQLT